MNERSNLPDDRMSGCRSFGSNYQPCSQSRKMSIGITVDSFPKLKPESSKRNEADVVVPENVKPSQGNSMVNGDNRKLKADITNNMEKRLESSGTKNSLWVSPKSVYQKMPALDNNHNKKQTMNSPAPGKSRRRSTVEKETSATYSHQSFANRNLNFKCNEQKEKMSDKIIWEENKRNDGTVQEQLPDNFAADVPHQNSRGCETLKLKLWEILGTVSSPNKHCSNSQDLNVASKSLHSELKHDTHSKPEGGAKDNSDSIESDTQNPTVRRPITRSLVRKRAPCSKKTIKRRNSPTTCYKDRLDKDIFSFKDVWNGGLSDALNDGLPTSMRKKVMSPTYGAEKCESLVLKADNAQSSKKSQESGKALSSTKKSTSRGNSMPFEPKNLDKDFCQTEPRIMEKVTKYIDTPNLQQSAGQPEGLGHSSLKNKVLIDVSTCSPSFKMNSLVRRSTSSSPTILEVQDLDKHSSRERLVSTKGTQSLEEKFINTCSPSTEMNTPLRRSPLASPRIFLDKDFCQIEPRILEKATKYIDTPNLPQSAGQAECLGHSSLKNKVLTDVSTCSPSFKLNSPVRRPTSSSPTTRGVQDLNKHSSRERIVSTKGTQSLKEAFISTCSPSPEMNTPLRRSPLESPRICKVQDVDEPSSGERLLNTKRMQSLKRYLGNLKYSHAASRCEVKDDCPSGSSSEEDSERSEDNLYERGYQHAQIASPDIINDEKSNSVSPLRKFFSNQKGVRINKRSASSSSRGEEARRSLMKHLEQNQDDGLTSAIALFSLALERLRRKVKSITRKKSTEILKSVADETYLLFQNAEKQVQADMENLADHGRSKRKRLETQIQDLQGQLTSVYDRFKQEVNQHVQDYRNTFEGSEALTVELRGVMEKQRELHSKLLSQAEEAIVNKLSEAQTRIDTVHNLGKGKMVQLKNILAEVLRDGVLI